LDVGSTDLGGIWDGSRDPSGEALGEVDMGDPALDRGDGSSSLSKNGFLLLSGFVKGLERPIVENVCSLFLVGMEELRKGLVGARAALGLLLVLATASLLLLANVSVNRVSLCTPETPFCV